jgi:hypothetical protein
VVVERARGPGDPQEIFDFWYNEIPAGDPFWDVVIGDPGIPNPVQRRCTCVVP